MAPPMIFDKEPLHRTPRQYGFSPARCDRLGEFLSRYAEQSLDLEIRQVLLARPADKIVRPDIQETEAMPQVIFAPRKSENVASVTMSGGRLKRAMSEPLSAPPATPKSKAIPAATAIGS